MLNSWLEPRTQEGLAGTIFILIDWGQELLDPRKDAFQFYVWYRVCLMVGSEMGNQCTIYLVFTPVPGRGHWKVNPLLVVSPLGNALQGSLSREYGHREHWSANICIICDPSSKHFAFADFCTILKWSFENADCDICTLKFM